MFEEVKYFCNIHNGAIEPLCVKGGSQPRKADISVCTKLEPTTGIFPLNYRTLDKTSR